jgi:glycosyltransferase involved in cell wall biosynthesis
MGEWVIASMLCMVWGWIVVRTRLGLSTIHHVPKLLPLPARLPLVSVIIAAKEEQESIQETIRYLHQQSYERLEIIAVNDRSSDATGARMDVLKAWSDRRTDTGPALKVIHITHLPAGWLGKNHALYQGYLQAKGSYILFTDADVRFEPHAIRDAVAYAIKEQADHVTLLPKLIAKTFWLKAFVHYFLFSLCWVVPPWTGNDDRQHKRGIGVGAFNLLRRDAYEGIGTHRALTMRPDDDLRLGMLIKQGGFKQRVAIGTRRITVEWYPSLHEAFRGLEKNLYSGFGYRLGFAVTGIVGQFMLFAWPFLALLWSRGPAWILYLVADLLLLTAYILHVRAFNEEQGREAAVLPVSVFLFIGVLLRSVVLAHVRKGVYWRGTFYSLAELRRLFQ